MLDLKFLLYCIEKHRITLALAMDGGAEEVSKNIFRANTHSNRAKLLIKVFHCRKMICDDLQFIRVSGSPYYTKRN